MVFDLIKFCIKFNMQTQSDQMSYDIHLHISHSDSAYIAIFSKLQSSFVAHQRKNKRIILFF